MDQLEFLFKNLENIPHKTIIIQNEANYKRLYYGQFEIQLNGKGTMKQQDGIIYEGKFKNNIDLKGKINYPNGDKYEGQIENLVPHGAGKLDFKDTLLNNQISMDGYFKNGLKHGLAKQTTNKGQLQFAFYENDKLIMIKNSADEQIKLLQQKKPAVKQEPKIDNTKIFESDNQKETILQWLNGKSLKLIYSANIDGWSSQTFHTKVDGRQNTLIAIKTTLDQIIGGFTDVSWNQSNKYVPSSNTWIFYLNFNKRFKIKKTKENFAIASNAHFGPYFGEDLAICAHSNRKDGSSLSIGRCYEFDYVEDQEKLNQKFQCSEFEVFQLN